MPKKKKKIELSAPLEIDENDITKISIEHSLKKIRNLKMIKRHKTHSILNSSPLEEL